MNSHRTSRLLIVVAPVVSAVIFLALWQLVVSFWRLPPLVLPGPAGVLAQLRAQADTLAIATAQTAAASAVAWLACGLFGLGIAVAFAVSPALRLALFPYVVFLQTVPIVAIAPLLILWSGSNFRTVVLVAWIIGVFPVISNTTSGLLAIEPRLCDLLRVLGASRRQTLVKLQLPHSLAAWSLGMRITGGLVVIGAIVGEFFVGTGSRYDGLGALIMIWQARQNTAGLFAALVATTVLGLLFYGAGRLLSDHALRRWTRGRL